jgi:hypothetical protein
MALRRKRIKPDRFELFWDQLAVLPIDAPQEEHGNADSLSHMPDL